MIILAIQLLNNVNSAPEIAIRADVLSEFNIPRLYYVKGNNSGNCALMSTRS
jgi:hypothetical protein